MNVIFPYPVVTITDEMLADAKLLEREVRVARTKASAVDALVGVLGEFVFAEWAFGDWHKHNVGNNKGKVDFDDVEVKASAIPFRDGLNLLVRKDYADKRKPPFYVQVILDVAWAKPETIHAGTGAILCGWASADEVDRSTPRHFAGGYLCYCIPLSDLNPMETFPKNHKETKTA